jgi:hypothetical protein
MENKNKVVIKPIVLDERTKKIMDKLDKKYEKLFKAIAKL